MLHFCYDQERAREWLGGLAGRLPVFACVLGFTETCLIPGISAAGSTPQARRFTALGDGEVLLTGDSRRVPTAPEGFPSPVVIARAVIELLHLDPWVLDAGLWENCPGAIGLGGKPARCLSTGRAMEAEEVEHLFAQGLAWGEKLAFRGDYLVVGECVAGGTTTALAVLRGLGFAADGLVNSSHPQCNHAQKQVLVEAALATCGLAPGARAVDVLAAVGDPAQAVLAGMAMGGSRHTRVLLAGGTQMLAVAALAERLARERPEVWVPERVLVGTTRWIAADPTANAAQLARLIGVVPLVAGDLNFSQSRFPGLRAYERGFVKEGVGAGGLILAAQLAGIGQTELLAAVEAVCARMGVGGV